MDRPRPAVARSAGHRSSAALHLRGDLIAIDLSPAHEDPRFMAPLSQARAGAVVCTGASQIWEPPVEEAQPLDHAAALSALRDLVPRGGRALYGEGIWSRQPTPAAVAPLAGRTDEHVTLPQLLEIVVDHGFAPLVVGEASQDEWDVFESGYAARYARWLAAHGSDHLDRAEVEARAARQCSAYFGGYRGVLGMAHLGLLAV